MTGSFQAVDGGVTFHDVETRHRESERTCRNDFRR